MGFFKNLFGKGEAKGEGFVPAPTQAIPGIPPIVVQGIESVFTSMEDQKIAFNCILELEKRGRTFRDPRLLLALLSYSGGNIESLKSSASQTHPHFWIDEIEPIFPKMNAAEEWVKTITKQ